LGNNRCETYGGREGESEVRRERECGKEGDREGGRERGREQHVSYCPVGISFLDWKFRKSVEI
jgi:hypothetical protein